MTALSLRVIHPSDIDGPKPMTAAEIFDEAERLHRANFPRAAAVALRCCIERYVLDLYDRHDIPEKTGWRANRLKNRIQQVRQAKLIEAGEVNVLTKAVGLGDRAAHGERIDRDVVAESLWQVATIVE